MSTTRTSPESDADQALDERHVALALSGGGVRSSSVCTGVMCWLATCGILERVTMVSVVSGGGYAGGSLVNWWAFHAGQGRAGARGAWLFKFFEHMLTTPNVLGSFNSPAAAARDLWALVCMFSVDFASVALCGLPEGLVLAEVVAAVLRAGAEPHTVPAPGAIWQQLQAVGYCTAVALALVLLVLLVVMMRRRTDTRKQASRRFMMQQRIVYVLSSVVFVVVHFAMATAVASAFLVVGAAQARNTWFLTVLAGVWLLSRSVKHIAGYALDAVTSSVTWMTVYGRMAAWRVAVEATDSGEMLGFHPASWRRAMFAVGVFMALVYPFCQLVMDDGWANFYRRHIARSYFPRQPGSKPRPAARGCPFGRTPRGVIDPTLDQLRTAETQHGVPRLVVNSTCNNWRRKVNVSVGESTVDAEGRPRVARDWDNGVAQVAFDSTGYTRMDEGCRGVAYDGQSQVDCACAGGGGIAAEASGSFDHGVPSIRLSTALGVSGAAVSSELGNKTHDWTVVSMLARTGITWGRYLNLSPELPWADTWLPAHAVFAALFLPLLLIPWCDESKMTGLVVIAHCLFCLFRITSPYHALWPALINFPPSRHFRETLNFDWWEPVAHVTGASDHHRVRHGMYMSDGGHTENLGVYPLLHRRAKRIISVDAGADPSHQCTSLLQVVKDAPRLFGCQFLAPRHLRREYPDVTQYIRDKLQLAKPSAFLLAVLYNPDDVAHGSAAPEEGELLYLKPRKSQPVSPVAKGRSAFRSLSGHSLRPDDSEFGSKSSFSSSVSCGIDSPSNRDASPRSRRLQKHGSSDSIAGGSDAAALNPRRRRNTTTGQPPREDIASEPGTVMDASAVNESDPAVARAAHFKATHGAHLPNEDMVGCCCNGCSRRSRCGWTSLFCGKFPNLSTMNQFLTEKQKRALHVAGFRCGMDAWDARTGPCLGFFGTLTDPSSSPAQHGGR